MFFLNARKDARNFVAILPDDIDHQAKLHIIGFFNILFQIIQPLHFGNKLIPYARAIAVIEIENIIQRGAVVGIGIGINVTLKIKASGLAMFGNIVDGAHQQTQVTSGQYGPAPASRRRVPAADFYRRVIPDMAFPVQNSPCQKGDFGAKAKTVGQRQSGEICFFQGVYGVAPAVYLLVAVADNNLGGFLSEKNIQHGRRGVLPLIEQNIVIGQLRPAELKFFQIKIMGDFYLTPVHFGQQQACLFFNIPVKAFHKSPRFFIRHNIGIIKFPDFFRRTVTKIGDEAVDMVGHHILAMLFPLGIQAQQGDDFVGFVTVVFQAVTVPVHDALIGQRVGGFYRNPGQTFGDKAFLRFQPHRFIKSQVKNFTATRSATGVFDKGGCFSGAGHSVYFYIAMGLYDGLLLIRKVYFHKNRALRLKAVCVFLFFKSMTDKLLALFLVQAGKGAQYLFPGIIVFFTNQAQSRNGDQIGIEFISVIIDIGHFPKVLFWEVHQAGGMAFRLRS